MPLTSLDHHHQYQNRCQCLSVREQHLSMLLIYLKERIVFRRSMWITNRIVFNTRACRSIRDRERDPSSLRFNQTDRCFIDSECLNMRRRWPSENLACSIRFSFVFVVDINNMSRRIWLADIVFFKTKTTKKPNNNYTCTSVFFNCLKGHHCFCLLVLSLGKIDGKV